MSDVYLKSQLPEHLLEYFEPAEIGLEQTPEEYIKAMVEVFRCVRDVLADDGTLWLNIGDSYNNFRSQMGPGQAVHGRNKLNGKPDVKAKKRGIAGLKEKDLIGIPWMLARALRDPYYTGPVKDVCDQVWLAAMLDAEGSICGTEYQTGDRIKTNIYISITNTSVPIIEKCDRLFPQEAKHIYEKINANSSRKCFRWDVERMDQKAMFLRTIYPHLVAKRKQAIIGYTFIEMQRGLVSKKKGYLPDQQEQRSWLMQALSLLNSGQDVDIPDWCIEPPSLFEPGYYLRQDIIWHKPNPMPESVRDRCTKAHEYVFLLSKSQKYFFDSEAMKEPCSEKTAWTYPQEDKAAGNAGNRNGRGASALRTMPEDGMRNKRSVWTVATKPYNGKKALTDYVGDDGKPYTASPDCPIHGHLSRRRTVGTRGYGEQQGQFQTGSVGTDSHHAASPAYDEQSTTCRSSQASAACNSQRRTTENSHGSKTDSRLTGHTSGEESQYCSRCNSASGEPLNCRAGCSHQCSSSTANFHSTEESKTDRDPATNQPCMLCAETDSHTQSKSNQHGLFEQDHGISESSILKGETSVHPSQDTHSCNAGTSSELVSMAYNVEKKCTCNEVIIDHFATFPPALIEPCILAGSRPGDIVLDPFMGSGTTAAVALSHGRQYLGCELNPEYGPLQNERIAAESNLFNTQVCGEQQ